MSEKVDIKVEQCTVIEWRPTNMPEKAEVNVFSPKFHYKNGECYFSFCYYYGDYRYSENDFGLNLHWSQEPHFPVEASVSLFKGTYSKTYPRKSRLSTGHVIFRDSAHAIKKAIPNFDLNHPFSFRIMIYDNFSSRADKMSLQMHSNLDSHGHLQVLSKNFFKLLEEDGNFDVEIKCGQDTFKAHRNILSSRSDVFRRMLHSSMTEGRTGIVEIQDTDHSNFQKFLIYLYCGKLPELTMDIAKGLYATGDKYAVASLKNACSEFLANNLTPNTACEILMLADAHHDEKFKDNIIEYCLDEKIPLKEEYWNSFSDRCPVLANEVLNRFIRKYCFK